MESAEDVRFLTNRDTYIPRQWVEESEELTWSYFKGFKAIDTELGELGEIVDVDDSTMNTLFVVEGENAETLIPAQEEFIVNIDHENKEIIFELPEGLVSM